jgi:hypothetical protein
MARAPRLPRALQRNREWQFHAACREADARIFFHRLESWAQSMRRVTRQRRRSAHAARSVNHASSSPWRPTNRPGFGVV